MSFLASPWNLRAGKDTLRCVALRRVRVPRVPRVGRVGREGASVSDQVLTVLIEYSMGLGILGTRERFAGSCEICRFSI